MGRDSDNVLAFAPPSNLVNGYWHLEIHWDDDLDSIICNFATMGDCVKVANKYIEYDSLSINFVKLDDPNRF